MKRSSVHHQRGLSIVEALIGTLVLSLGVLATLQVQSQLRLGADSARARAEAMRLAQQDMEQLRGFTALSGAQSYTSIASSTQAPDPASHTAFTLTRHVSQDTTGGHKTAAIDVSWNDRSGVAQHVALDSLIAGQAPTLAAALSVPHDRLSARGVHGRAVAIPAAAHDLGDGRSLWKPTPQASIAYVFDNATGRIKTTCHDVGAQTMLQLANLLKAGVLTNCVVDDALLLSGIVRVSTTVPPRADAGAEAPPSLGVTLTVDGRPAQNIVCTTEAQQAVAILTATGRRREAVALTATPVSLGVPTWAELGDRFVAYHCRVPRLAGGWSGRSRVVPDGWTVGSLAGDRRICRYGAADNGDGSIANADHPEHYHAVNDALLQQNFLLVRGDQACPDGTFIHL